MELSLIQKHVDQFESYKHTTGDGVEFWLARELQELLGYSKWENFSEVIERAKISCKTNKIEVSDHFPDVGKMIEIGKGGQREVERS